MEKEEMGLLERMTNAAETMCTELTQILKILRPNELTFWQKGWKIFEKMSVIVTVLGGYVIAQKLLIVVREGLRLWFK
jgi:hypothetical protein